MPNVIEFAKQNDMSVSEVVKKVLDCELNVIDPKRHMSKVEAMNRARLAKAKADE